METLNTQELIEWLKADPSREALLIKETPISKSYLNNIRGGYIPHERTIKALNAVIARVQQQEASKRAS